MQIKKAVILAGGLGTRLRPLTLEMPKSLITVHRKTLIEHLLDLFKRYGITDITLAVGHMSDQIKERFGDGREYGVNISYVEEKEPLGTAGCLRLIKDRLTETFIMTNGDELKELDLEEMEKVHKDNDAAATIALWQVEDPSAYGVAKIEGNKILQFVEKPKKEEAPSNLINSGLYMIEPEVIDMIPEGFVMLEKDIFPKLAEQEKLFGYPFKGQWFDTGTFERWETAIEEWNDLD
ncbi:NTP transferase domain-containing protein [Candidatus Woesearchaeota archaeon]|nr:NTP transferase domain-containing protein [Candidatus Woesearchaeota archaeon]